jgi:hypothetical protein
LEGDSPRISHHHEAGAVGLGLVRCDVGGTGRFEAAAVGMRVARNDGKVKTQRVRCGVVRNAGSRIGVELDYDATGLIGEETSEWRLVETADDFEAKVSDVPVSVRARIGHIEGEVFEFH